MKFSYSRTREADIGMMLAARSHIGAQNAEIIMKPYVYKRQVDGTHIFNLGKTWEKLMLAARIIAGVANPADVLVVGERKWAQRAVIKFAGFTEEELEDLASLAGEGPSRATMKQAIETLVGRWQAQSGATEEATS